MLKNPRNECDLPSCGDHVHWGLRKMWGFRLPLRVKCLGKRDLYQLMGIVLTSALGSTLMGIGLHNCFVTRCSVVWKDLWPSGALSVQLTFTHLEGVNDLN